MIQEIAAMGANIIRVPVHPGNYVNDADYLWRYLDPIVKWAGKEGMYVAIDWHFIGNVATGAGDQMPDDLKENPKDLTLAFWKLTASYFKDTPNVIFEIFNEPQSISADVWQANADEIVNLIRGQGANQLIIVGGIDFGRDLSWVLDNPIKDTNIAYASHIYPIHETSGYDTWFGDTAAQYPVLITEWGFMDSSSDPSLDYLVGTADQYGSDLMTYLDDRGIGWIACWYDDVWVPVMFEKGGKVLTKEGEFIKGLLADH
jgi:endoglucanase